MVTPIVEIDLPFGADPSFFCPVCGTNLMAPTENGDAPSCPHLIFTYLSQIADFGYSHPDFTDALTKHSSKAGSEEDYLTDLPRAVLKFSPVFFRVHCGGMACGPVWETLDFGISPNLPLLLKEAAERRDRAAARAKERRTAQPKPRKAARRSSRR